MKKILLLSANPKDTTQLRVDEEMREIREGLRRSKQRENFVVETAQAVRYRDIRRAILDHEPNIVHFSGHGAGEEGLIFEDETGQSKLVEADALARLFELFADFIECVVLNACYSEVQAKAISQHIPYVVGMNKGIGDKAAIEFTLGFYDGLGAGKSVEFAYQLGRNSIEIGGIPETLTPLLIEKGEQKLLGYDQALKKYEQEFSAALQQKYPIISESDRLRLQRFGLVLGLREDDIAEIERQIEDIEEIRLAVERQSIGNYQRLAQAIMQRMNSTDWTPLTSSHFPDGSLWEMILPSTGLQLPTQKAIFYLSEGTNSTLHNHLKQITQQRDGVFLIVASVSDGCPHGLAPLQVILLNRSSLREMIETSEKDLLVWLARFLFGQINVVALPGMLPYKTKGIATLFFGREHELANITSSSQKGGIIIGAHRSGKTSFLEKLKDRLQQRQCKVVGPLTFFKFQSFFKETLDPLGQDYSPGMNIENWACALKGYSQSKTRLVFLLDEVDRMIEEDWKKGSLLGQQMRALQNGGNCEFFLAGHARLREAITLEGGPFRNFAEEITLIGLTKEAATDLIQTPMKLLGFEVSDTQASRIAEGTAGVAVLIQEFCLKLLDELRQSGASEISDRDIEVVEQSPDFLDVVFEHYQYGQAWDSLAITILTAMHREVQRKDITETLKEHGINLVRDRLDAVLKFLTRFGVLHQFKAGCYRVLSSYLTEAINENDPDELLRSELAKGKAS